MGIKWFRFCFYWLRDDFLYISLVVCRIPAQFGERKGLYLITDFVEGQGINRISICEWESLNAESAKRLSKNRTGFRPVLC